MRILARVESFQLLLLIGFDLRLSYLQHRVLELQEARQHTHRFTKNRLRLSLLG
jgi:hypothetical protein